MCDGVREPGSAPRRARARRAARMARSFVGQDPTWSPTARCSSRPNLSGPLCDRALKQRQNSRFGTEANAAIPARSREPAAALQVQVLVRPSARLLRWSP